MGWGGESQKSISVAFEKVRSWFWLFFNLTPDLFSSFQQRQFSPVKARPESNPIFAQRLTERQHVVTTDLLVDNPSCGALQKLISSIGPAAFHQLLSTTKSQPAHFSLWNVGTLFLKRSRQQFSGGILSQQGIYSILYNSGKYMPVPFMPVPSETEIQNGKPSSSLVSQT